MWKLRTVLLTVGMTVIALSLVADEAEKYDLILKFTKGEKLYYESSNKQTQTMLMMSDKQEAENQSTMEIEVISLDEDGTGTVISRVLRIKSVSPQGEYDSAGSVDHPVSDAQKKSFEAILRCPLKGKISPKGECKEIQGVEELMKEMQDYINESLKPFEDKPAFKEMMNKLIQKTLEANIRSSLSVFAFLPKDKVAVGETWQVKQDKDLTILEWEATLKEVFKNENDKQVAKITLLLKSIKMDKEKNPIATFETPENVKGEGEIEFNINDGKITAIKVSVSYDRKSTMSEQIVGSRRVESKMILLKEPPKIEKKEEPKKETKPQTEKDEEKGK